MTDLPPRSGAFTDPGAPAERYVLLDRLGEGGMGVVWRARDTLLERDVALKTVAQRDDELEERLAREVRIVARLASPGIVQVLDRGSLPDGRPFVVLELLDVPALGRGHDDWSLLTQAARAVGEAHRQGLVHRDLKPSNLGLRGDQLVVLDWGLAKPVEDSGWNERVLGSPLTASGVAVGTLGYMAPEQIASGDVGPATDVWALGAIAYEVATGRTAWADGRHVLLTEVSRGTLEVPAGPLGELIRSALSLDPADRPVDGHAFAAALEQACRPTPTSRRRWWGTAAVGALGLLVGAAFPLMRAPAEHTPAPAAHDLHVRLGRSLAGQGRFLEARQQGQLAERLGGGPAVRGLLALPHAPPPVVTEHACDRIHLFDGHDRWVCDRPDRLTVHDGLSTLVHDVPHDMVWLGPDGLIIRDHWRLRRLDDDGGSFDYPSALPRPVGVAWGAPPVVLTGPQLVTFDEQNRTLADGLNVQWAVTLRDGRVVVHDTDTDQVLVVDEDGPHTLFELHEPVVAGIARPEGLLLVGLRGTVVELDPDDLHTEERYHLRYVQQVQAAAWDGSRLAVSTPDGVFVYQRGEPELQLDIVPREALGWAGGGRLRAASGRTTWTWDVAGSASLMVPERLSTTALRGGDEAAMALQERVYTFDPERLRWGPSPRRGTGKGPIRSLVQPWLAVDNDELFRLEGDTYVRVGDYPVVAQVDPDHAIGARRWGRGIAVIRRDGTLERYPEHPMIRTLVADSEPGRALGLDDQGRLLQFDLEGHSTLVDAGPIRVVAAGPAGRLVARGDGTIELLGAWRTTCDGPVGALAVGTDHVAAGTMDGLLCVYGTDGTDVLRVEAHPERISALVFWRDLLFSGSWAPGVRKWRLPQSRSSTSSPG